MKNMKLRPAIAIGLIVGILIPTMVAGWYTLKKHREFLKREIGRDHARITRVLSLGMQEPVWTMVPEKGESFVDAIMADERIVRVSVTSEDGLFLEKIGDHTFNIAKVVNGDV